MPKEFVIRTPDQLSPVVSGFRRARGVNQTELGAQLGLSQKTYSALELHPDRTSVTRFLALLSALQVELVLRDKLTGETIGSGPATEW